MPSYGHARFIEDAIRSVLAQTFTDWELIVVDDQSPDNSLELVRKFDDDRIRSEQNPANLGTYGTQQRALEMAKHDLIAVMNSDDLWLPAKLEMQFAALQKHPGASFCFCLGWVVDGEGITDETDDVHADWPIGVRDYLPWLLYENRILASGVVFRREGLQFQTKAQYSGDWMALLQASRRGPGICVAERLTRWRVHGNNTFTRSSKQVAEEIAVRESILRAKWPGDVNAGLGRNALNLMTLYAQTGRRHKAWKLTRAVMHNYPDRGVALRRVALMYMPTFILARRLPWMEPASKDPAILAFDLD